MRQIWTFLLRKRHTTLANLTMFVSTAVISYNFGLDVLYSLYHTCGSLFKCTKSWIRYDYCCLSNFSLILLGFKFLFCIEILNVPIISLNAYVFLLFSMFSSLISGYYIFTRVQHTLTDFIYTTFFTHWKARKLNITAKANVINQLSCKFSDFTP